MERAGMENVVEMNDAKVSVRHQIVIPMSGFGERFRRAGYDVPKPLIEVDGRPIIEHVVRLFPGETDFVFVCNEDHLADPGFDMRGTLERICPSGRILGIPAHKEGPVWAVAQAASMLDPDRPVMVNYCDFSCLWDWEDFKSFVVETNCDGAIPAYRGFHPHSLGSTFYAYLRQRDGWADGIREKRPWTDDPSSEYASSGAYWFRSASLMLDAFRRLEESGENVGGERYVSLAYLPLFKDGARVAVYEIPRFMQWGTPEDLDEYVGWSEHFRRRMLPRERAAIPGAVVIPAAGLGERFSKEGFSVPKAVLPVDGTPMIGRATRDLPMADVLISAMRKEMPGRDLAEAALRSSGFPSVRILGLDGPTDGQARTIALALAAAGDFVDLDAPLVIGACDNGADYDGKALVSALNSGADVLVWCVRGHAAARRKPESYGWVDADASGRVLGVSVKRPLSNPARDPVIIGAFAFRRASDFLRCFERLVADDVRINGELYADSCVGIAASLGLDARVFEVDFFPCWGTPSEYATYHYWRSAFSAWSSHPYDAASDHFSEGAAGRDAFSGTCAIEFRSPRPGLGFPSRPHSSPRPEGAS